MAKQDREYSPPVKCDTCSATVAQLVVIRHSQVRTEEDDVAGMIWEEGPIYELLECTHCAAITLKRYYWHEMMSPGDETIEKLFPAQSPKLKGLPPPIERAHVAAQRVRSVDSNSYGVLIGRLLELICIDRNAGGRSLRDKLDVLVANGDIPKRLADAASKLRAFRNVGAHAELGELTAAELPILDDLTRALLEYVYSLPGLIEDSEKRLESMGKLRKKTSKKAAKSKSPSRSSKRTRDSDD